MPMWKNPSLPNSSLPPSLFLSLCPVSTKCGFHLFSAAACETKLINMPGCGCSICQLKLRSMFSCVPVFTRIGQITAMIWHTYTGYLCYQKSRNATQCLMFLVKYLQRDEDSLRGTIFSVNPLLITWNLDQGCTQMDNRKSRGELRWYHAVEKGH